MSESYDGEGAARNPRGPAARLPEELRALGRSLDAPRGDGIDGVDGVGGVNRVGGIGIDIGETMAERVLAQLLAERVPVPVAEPPGAAERLRAVRRWTRARWRSLTAALCGLLTVLVLTPPVRAAVVDWFDFGGVEVRYDPSASPSPGAQAPDCGGSLSLAEARLAAGFEPLVPDALGAPDEVAVTREPQGRFLISLCWSENGRPIRLDEYPAHLDVSFAKTLREPPEWVDLDTATHDDGGPDPALWFPKPHLLSFWLVDADGNRYTREKRTAGPTLLWVHGAATGDVTLRLEGVSSKARAVQIARSLG
ncbi:hypothetical protein [Streptomyces sp. ME18-1-4]|uniref:hypothetical protein n=1 Tax=Streptomyces sp. ME18-1-4 TaxID=3028685 RepID=UPI0029A48BB8|nr:hypothetical protein [Streptomyces sp. ME18-1-4]MDX3244570.1 hypothetical protein [Streptomyces sp. ME18-1-4]